MSKLREFLKPTAWLAFSWLAFVGGSACSNVEENKSKGEISYKLERDATNNGENAILLQFPKDSGYLVRVSGGDFTSSIPKDRLLPVQDRIEIRAEGLGKFAVNLVFALSDKTEFLEDTLVWEYGYEVPPEPIVSFSEEASNDEHVSLLVSSSRGPSVDEIWVEGDVKPGASWSTIPSSGKVPIVLSDGDGTKSLRVKLRNRFGNVSPALDMAILRKSLGPQNCSAEPVAEKISGSQFRMRLRASNEGPLYYRVLGDIDQTQPFKEFAGDAVEEIALSPGAGAKTLTVTIRDVAENYCPPLTLNVTVDPEYLPYSVTIDHPRLWIDSYDISVSIRYDSFESENIEMFIDGGVDPGPYTFQWIPYRKDLDLKLSPFEGNRFVFVHFRVGGELAEKVNDAIYLKPYVRISGTGAKRSLRLSSMLGIAAVSIEGCQEAYDRVEFAETLPCTPIADDIEVEYEMVDGSRLIRSVSSL